jgi:nucleotide-binding universal stress UspA family protein
MAKRSSGRRRARQADTGRRHRPSMKTILHPSDFSAASRPAFKKAIELAKRDRAMLELLRVISPVYPVGFRLPPSAHDRVAATATAAARKRLVELASRAPAAGAKATLTIVEGTPAARIVHAARATHADLVVMGTHGRTGLSRFLLGSVASRVIAIATSHRNDPGAMRTTDRHAASSPDINAGWRGQRAFLRIGPATYVTVWVNGSASRRRRCRLRTPVSSQPRELAAVRYRAAEPAVIR